MFNNCQRLVHQINAKSALGTPQERKLTQNILASLASQLQDQTSAFRTKQASCFGHWCLLGFGAFERFLLWLMIMRTVLSFQVEYSNRCARREAHSGQLFDMTMILEQESDPSFMEDISAEQVRDYMAIFDGKPTYLSTHARFVLSSTRV